jgi:hypothetical protein
MNNASSRYVTLHSQWNRKIGCIHVAVAALPGASTSLTVTSNEVTSIGCATRARRDH